MGPDPGSEIRKKFIPNPNPGSRTLAATINGFGHEKNTADIQIPAHGVHSNPDPKYCSKLLTVSGSRQEIS
jgi:hypothetical protein